MSIDSLVQRRHDLIGNAPLFYKTPVHIVRGEGALLYDADGRQYIDMYNNVPCVGHANPHVVRAMQEQLATLNVHSRYLHEGILDYAERLLAKHHDGLESVVFSCSGTEASEIALMVARLATGGRGIICTDATYHGNSEEVRKLSLASLTETPADAEYRAIPFPQRYHPLADVSGDKLTELYLDRVRQAIEAFRTAGVPFAGMFVCSILANEGLPDIPEKFMEKATALVHEAGGLMIADEVQAGFCRSGDWWGYETSGFKPDIVTMGKPMGNGLPMSGVAASRDLIDTFRRNTRYFNTFASSPLQAATGMAVLDVIEREDLLARSAAIGEHLRQELKTLQPNCDAMGDVRGCGLFTAVEWVSDKATREPDREGAVNIANALKEKGILLGNAGAKGNVIKIRPPLVFQSTHADQFLTAFKQVIEAL
jgi:4-aminobutyrate aminotransferase-like enzyme